MVGHEHLQVVMGVASALRLDHDRPGLPKPVKVPGHRVAVLAVVPHHAAVGEHL